MDIEFSFFYLFNVEIRINLNHFFDRKETVHKETSTKITFAHK